LFVCLIVCLFVVVVVVIVLFLLPNLPESWIMAVRRGKRGR
jgi:hypothetical protein